MQQGHADTEHDLLFNIFQRLIIPAEVVYLLRRVVVLLMIDPAVVVVEEVAVGQFQYSFLQDEDQMWGDVDEEGLVLDSVEATLQDAE